MSIFRGLGGVNIGVETRQLQKSLILSISLLNSYLQFVIYLLFHLYHHFLNFNTVVFVLQFGFKITFRGKKAYCIKKITPAIQRLYCLNMPTHTRDFLSIYVFFTITIRLQSRFFNIIGLTFKPFLYQLNVYLYVVVRHNIQMLVAPAGFGLKFQIRNSKSQHHAAHLEMKTYINERRTEKGQRSLQSIEC